MDEINYDIMRYELNNEGYVLNVFFGCSSGNCTGYEGDVPEGYNSLEEWADTANIRAYKIVDGNLVYDENKDKELQAQYEKENEENCLATKAYVESKLGVGNQIIIDEFSNLAQGLNIVKLENSGEYTIPGILAISSGEEVNLIASNKNLLRIDAVSTSISGIDFTINEDHSITLNGTSTAKIELPLSGAFSSTEMLFYFHFYSNYSISGLDENILLNLYSYDGTERTLVGSVGNETLTLETPYNITQVDLVLEAGLTYDNVTIYPQIEFNDEATNYVKHEENRCHAVTDENGEATIETMKAYSDTTIVMSDIYTVLYVVYFQYKSLENKFAEIEVNEDIIRTQVSDTKTEIIDLQTQMTTIESTILEQTNDAFTMWFEQTGLQQDLDAVKKELDSNTSDINTLTEYIRFEGAEITLGRSDSQTKLILKNDRISFMTGDTESAYISENTLYITDSTILNKMQVGHWETKEDEYGNLNTKWIGDN